MYIQYNISDGDIVNIQATNSEAADNDLLLSQGRAQYEVDNNIKIASQVNIKTGQIVPLIFESNDASMLIDEGYVAPFKQTLTKVNI